MHSKTRLLIPLHTLLRKGSGVCAQARRLAPVLFLCVTVACNFEKNLDLDLNGPKELFVEAYLETGKPGQMLLTTTQGYFDSLALPFIDAADARLTLSGASYPFRNRLVYDLQSGKFYNYQSDSLPLREGQTVTLTVKDTLGRQLTGQSVVLPVIPIDSVRVSFSALGDSAAYLSIWLTDPPSQTDYYRLIVNKDSIGAPAAGGTLLQDNARDGKPIALRTGYNFKPGNKVYIRLYHLEKTYYDYINSVEEAQGANGNPFAQPASIKSTVQGGKGVFTILRYDLDSLVIPNP